MKPEAPSPFTKENPKLQQAWDSTSLGALMKCPRAYQYSILEGWRAEGSADLVFGGLFASSTETYKKARLNGQSKEEATLATIRFVIEASVDPDTRLPWGGQYQTQWRCTGTTPYRNAKGNRAKCPYSHAHVWFPEPTPSMCGECGSAIETKRNWVGEHAYKDRVSLVRLVAAYCDYQPETAEEGPYPLAFPNGQPAVELSFQLPLPYSTPGKGETREGQEKWRNSGEPYLLTGHIDSIMRFGNENFISDNKTTKNYLNDKYFDQYSPNLQVDIYDFAGSILWPELGVKGVMIEGAQVLKEGIRLGNGIAHRNEAQREEFLRELEYWLRQAEKFARDNYWPMNRKSCYLCEFKSICSKDPSKREQYLKSNFSRRFWNPLEER